MPGKAFLEITNICNLHCSFCHKTKRQMGLMAVDKFQQAAQQIRPFADYIYFHLMGEPLLHPELGQFLQIAEELGFRVILTTNGTLLDKRQEVLIGAKSLHKVSISLHSFEDDVKKMEPYMSQCFRFCEDAAANGIISVLRLWNLGAEHTENAHILQRMHDWFDTEWKEIYSGYKIRDKIFLEWGERFDWPDQDAEPVSTSHSCFGLRDQFGVLVDGTVVPCCLDADGAIPLGNLFETPLAEILASPRAAALRKSFETRQITEPLCQRCGYAKMKNYK